MVFRIVYLSEAIQSFDSFQLQELALLSAENNQRFDITGYLNFKQGIFHQYLEGTDEAVQTLLNKISRDGRHKIINVLQLGEGDWPIFPDWSMKYVSSREIVEIGLEDVLEDVLRTMAPPVFTVSSARPVVLRLCRKIASAIHNKT